MSAWTIPPGHWYKHFSARDVISRWDVLGVYSRATAATARDFLDAVIERMPGPVRAIQVDGGSEFKAEFEEACREKGLRLFVLPPRSPKLNGCVERAQRTHKEEFYQMLDPPDSLDELRRLLLAQEQSVTTPSGPTRPSASAHAAAVAASIPGKGVSVRHVPDEYRGWRHFCGFG